MSGEYSFSHMIIINISRQKLKIGDEGH